MYNGIGNIESVITTPKNGSAYTTTFGYDTSTDESGNLINPDRLVSYNGKAITYDTLGRLASYDGRTYTWTRDKLTSISSGVAATGRQTYNYTYNALGQRVKKSYSYFKKNLSSGGFGETAVAYTTSKNTQYYYDNAGRLIAEFTIENLSDFTQTSTRLEYLYDESGMIGFKYNASGVDKGAYYFQRNLQGDVVAIYNTSGSKIVEYAYDAFGNCTITYGANNDIATANAIRYRGYYWDSETGLYYLNARYYNPEWRRFISPDDTSYLNPENVNGLNLYCYCGNDPVNYCDPSGCFSITAILIGAAIGFATSYLSDVIDNTKDGFEWSDFNTFEENWLKYIGSTLGGAIGGLGTGFASTLFCGGMSSVVEGLFTNDVSSIREAIISMAFGGLLSGIGYGFSKGIVKMFANRKITSILGNMSENIKVNKRLSQAGFGYLKIGKHGYKNIYEEIYDVLGYDTAQTIVSYGFDITIGLIF